MLNNVSIFIEGKGYVDFGHVLGTEHQAPVAKLLCTLVNSKDVRMCKQLPVERETCYLNRSETLDDHVTSVLRNFQYYVDNSLCYRENGFMYIYTRVYKYDYIYSLVIFSVKTIQNMNMTEIQSFCIKNLFRSYEKVANLFSKYRIGINRTRFLDQPLDVFDKNSNNGVDNRLAEIIDKFFEDYPPNLYKTSSKVHEGIRNDINNDYWYSLNLLPNEHPDDSTYDATRYLVLASNSLDVKKHSKIIIELYRNIINIGTYETIMDKISNSSLDETFSKYVNILNSRIIPNLLTQIWFTRKKGENGGN